MKTIPEKVKAYKKTDVFTQDTIPAAILNEHATKAGVWGKIVILEGKLIYTIIESTVEYTLTPDLYGVVEPEVLHKVSPIGEVKFYVEFYK